MFEKFFSSESRNFRQRYEGTYGFFVNPKGEKLLSRIEYIAEEESPKYVKFIDKKGNDFKLYADADSDVGFQFLPPKATFHNTSVGTFFVSRRAARQYQRGVSENNLTIFKIDEKGFTPMRVNFSSLEPIFEQNISYVDAVQLYKQGKKTSIALSPQFAITTGRVFAYDICIGEFANTTETISLYKGYEMFKQELLDALRHNNLPIPKEFV